MSKKDEKLSIVIPLYNEVKTFEDMLKALQAVKLPIPVEYIIVESNSTDGSRELAKKYEKKKGFKVFYQSRPMGKGSAVKLGFKKATGSIIAIQDADLEYDPKDYPKLLQPILDREVKFVLGSRHMGKESWKIRDFRGNKLKSAFVNIGSQFLDTVFWILYGVRLTDPQTMYKLFRKECIKGITFETNHFQMDYEIVIKLVKQGFIPKELPIKYDARTHDEGKKVKIIQTGFQDLAVMFKFRFL